MAARFWVGGTANWDATAGTKWALTSGGLGGQAVPTTSDDVTFDSGSGTCAVTITATANCSTLTSSSANVTLSAGSNTINVNLAGGTGWNWSAGTFTAGTSNIVLAGGTTFAGGSQTYATLTGNGAAIVTITGNNTFTNLSRTGTAAKNDRFILGGNQTITGTLTIKGNSAINRLAFASDTVGIQRSVTVNTTVTAQNVDISRINALGTASWNLSAITGNSGDTGGNTGITFTTPATQTWSGTSGGNWSANAWTSRVPLPQDDVIVNAAFSASQTITNDMPRMGHDINFTGVTGSPALTFSGVAGSVLGSLTLAAGLGTITLTTAILLGGFSSHTFTTAGKSFTGTAVIQMFCSGTYTLQDDMAFTSVTTGGLQVLSGTFNANNHNLTAPLFTIVTIQSAPIPVVNMGNGTWKTISTNAATVWSAGNSSNATINAQTSTILISGASANTRTFDGGGQTYNIVTYTEVGSTGQLNVVGSNTFDTINFSDATNARTLAFTAATTTTITGTFNVNGTSGKLMSVNSITAATHTLTKTSGNVACDYLSLTNSIATGGANWYAGANSTNVSGNTGWMFTGVGLIAFDVASNSGYKAASSSYSWTHTTNGINRNLIVGVSMLSVGGTTVSSITYNSIALTKVRSDTSVSTVIRTEIWILTAPTVGSNTIAVTLSGAADSAGGAVSFVESAQSSPVDAQNGNFAVNVGAADATVDVVTVTDNTIVVDTVATDDTAITIGAGQTSRWNVTGTLGSGAGSTEPKATAGTVTMSWTNVGAAQSWVIGAVAIKQVSATTVRSLALLGVG